MNEKMALQKRAEKTAKQVALFKVKEDHVQQLKRSVAAAQHELEQSEQLLEQTKSERDKWKKRFVIMYFCKFDLPVF